MLENIKVLLGIEDDLQDHVLNILINNTNKHLLTRLKILNKEIEEVPKDLDYIVQEIVVRRFNRLGTEGMKSESVEGHKVDFYELEKDFTPYEDIINSYADDETKGGGRGKVIMI